MFGDPVTNPKGWEVESLGDLVEFGATEQIFFKPNRKETEDYITGRFG